MEEMCVSVAPISRAPSLPCRPQSAERPLRLTFRRALLDRGRYSAATPAAAGSTAAPSPMQGTGEQATIQGTTTVTASRPSTRDRAMVIIRMKLLTTKRPFWHCGAHTAKPESASRRRLLVHDIVLFCRLW